MNGTQIAKAGLAITAVAVVGFLLEWRPCLSDRTTAEQGEALRLFQNDTELR